MKLDDLKELFDDLIDSEAYKFDRIEHKLHSMPDICAMMYLYNIVGGINNRMFCSAEHNEMFFDYLDEDLEKLTEEDALYLVRCGVYFGEYGGLCLCV